MSGDECGRPVQPILSGQGWCRQAAGHDGPCAPVPRPAEEPDREALVERACEVMHDAYEAAAVGAGWETQAASRKPWSDVPEANKATMRAAASALLDWLPTPPAPGGDRPCDPTRWPHNTGVSAFTAGEDGECLPWCEGAAHFPTPAPGDGGTDLRGDHG